MRYMIMTLFLTIVLTGCAPKVEYLYYGDYSKKYYNYIKKRDDNSKKDFLKVLVNIEEKSKSKGTPVPPGIYCEHALILLGDGNNGEAAKYFELEKNTWKESAQFIDTLIKKLNTGK